MCGQRQGASIIICSVGSFWEVYDLELANYDSPTS
jgi:hypothetical protein